MSISDSDRLFPAEPGVRDRARELYGAVRDLPLVCPHGHVDPQLLLGEGDEAPNPAEFLIIPDHYVFRMLHSQGIPLEKLGVPRLDGQPVETDGRRIWQLFADNFHLFAGTPTGLWLRAELADVFGITAELTPENAQAVYDELNGKLASPEYSAANLFRRFNIELLATTDAATDSLDPHQALQAKGLRVIPTFRPDSLFKFRDDDWAGRLERLTELTGQETAHLSGFVHALELRRKQFREAGAVATDHARVNADIRSLPRGVAETLFDKALNDRITGNEAAQLEGHMLFEQARMSTEDGLVMQLHLGSYRNHDPYVFETFGPDKGADIPVAIDWTRGLRELLGRFGRKPGFRLLAFTLDESTYSRELAPLAGYWPALRLGPPWWFFDSVKGIERYLDATVETAGFRNLAGFNDDTRAFASIPARHDLWRRVTCGWLANEAARGLLTMAEAHDAAAWLAVGAARSAYGLDG